MTKNGSNYFLATNSCKGFVSYFGDSCNPKEGWNRYIIKGGPGTGKSTFMKSVAKQALKKGQRVEYFPCSSDPNSLDAIIFPQLKVIIMDGTAPHVVEPIYPAVTDEILNFGQFWNTEKIKDNAEKIISLTDENKELHKRASLYLNGMGLFLQDNRNIFKKAVLAEKIENFCNKFCKEYFSKQKNIGREDVRFLSGVTPSGVVSYTDTVTDFYKSLIIIEDDYGYVSNLILEKIRLYTLKMGYEIVTLKNNYLPENTDGIIIPSISLAIVREGENLNFKSNVRRIHTKRFTDINILNLSKERMKFNKKVARELLKSAINILKEAKNVHNDLEEFYISEMDFPKLTEFQKEFSKKIFS